MKRTTIALLALAACSGDSAKTVDSAQPAADQGAMLSPERATVRGVRLGMSEQDVSAVVGSPTSTALHIDGDAPTDTAKTLHYARIMNVELVGGKVVFIRCENECVSADNVRTGDPASKVRETYATFPQGNVLSARSITLPVEGGCSITFGLKEGRVTTISAGCGG